MTEVTRVIACGSRAWGEAVDDARLLNKTLGDLLYAYYPDELVIVHGDAQGADKMARAWAFANKVPHEPHPADWRFYGKKAGVLRNREMAALGAEMVYAFSKSPMTPGTADMCNVARRAGIPVTVVYG